MKTLGLDISSTKTGFAVITDGVLVNHGLITGIKPDRPGLCEDFIFIERASYMADEIYKVIVHAQPDMLFIEQTNLGNSRTDQKLLEFVHYAVLSKIIQMERQSETRYVDTSSWRSVLKIKLNSDQRLNNKLVKLGKIKGKVTPKHLAVIWANETYSLELLKKDHDIADAIALATYGQRKANEPTEAHHDIEKILASQKLVV